jgi:hypothetical protein
MILASVLSDLRDWVGGVLDRIGEVPIPWLLVALGLKTVESALIGLTWRNILRAAYPKSNLSFKTSWELRREELRSTPSRRPRRGLQR